MRQYINNGNIKLEPDDSAETFAFLRASPYFGEMADRVPEWFEDNIAHHSEDHLYGQEAPDLPFPVFEGHEIVVVVGGLRKDYRELPADDIRRAETEVMLSGYRLQHALMYGELVVSRVTGMPSALTSSVRSLASKLHTRLTLNRNY